MSAKWKCKVETAIDLQRPSRRAFDRLRECVIKTSATAPSGDSDDESESVDSADESAASYEPAYVKNVIIEIQHRNEVWQTKCFNVVGKGVQRVDQTFTIPKPAPGAALQVRALKLHRVQSNALIGEAEIKQVNGAVTVTLKRKGKPKGAVSIYITDPNPPPPKVASPAATPSPVAKSATLTSETPVVADENPSPLATEEPETDGEGDPTVALLRPEDGHQDRDVSFMEEGGASDDESKKYRSRWFGVLASFGIAILALAAYARIGGGYSAEYTTPGPGIDEPLTMRQFMKGEEMRDLMADNIMTIGHEFLGPEDRQEVRAEVARHVEAFDETLDEDDPVTAAEMDKLIVSEDTKEDVLKVMSGISDNRVVRLANDVEDAMHDAATFSLSRAAFKTSLATKMESKMEDIQELRQEYFPR